jgi:hypothetical protein
MNYNALGYILPRPTVFIGDFIAGFSTVIASAAAD